MSVNPQEATIDDAGAAAAAPAKRVRPFIKWAGGKTKLLAEIGQRLPERFNAYHEPMLGGGAVFFAVAAERTAYLSDSSAELINCYRVVRDHLEELLDDLRSHFYDEDYFYRVRNIDRTPEYETWSDVRRAGRFIYLNKTCFNGLYRVNSRGHFNVPFGRYASPTIVDEENLRACSAALKSAVLERKPFEESLEAISEGDLVYLDPPYDPLNDTSSFTAYTKEGFGPEQQRALRDYCDAIDERGAFFLLSNSYTTLTLKLYERYRIDLVRAPRSINSKPTARGEIREILVSNYG